jgi:hypothetical protein
MELNVGIIKNEKFVKKPSKFIARTIVYMLSFLGRLDCDFDYAVPRNIQNEKLIEETQYFYFDFYLSNRKTNYKKHFSQKFGMYTWKEMFLKMCGTWIYEFETKARVNEHGDIAFDIADNIVYKNQNGHNFSIDDDNKTVVNNSLLKDKTRFINIMKLTLILYLRYYPEDEDMKIFLKDIDRKMYEFQN